MLAADCWSHYCPDNRSPWEYFDDVNYNYLFAGENLAEGFFLDEDAMVAWMNSPSHRENILKPEYKEVGFGVVHGNFQGQEDNTVIVAHFGARQDESVAVLSEIYDFLIQNPNVNIEIGGHTNTIPSDAYCDRLSADRARNVAEYFYNRGIPASQISYKGYGKRQPLTKDESLAGRKKNQRVEIKILAM